MIALVDLVLNGIIYCSKGMRVDVLERTGKYTTVYRVDWSSEKPKEIKFNVSTELMPLYFM